MIPREALGVVTPEQKGVTKGVTRIPRVNMVPYLLFLLDGHTFTPGHTRSQHRLRARSQRGRKVSQNAYTRYLGDLGVTTVYCKQPQVKSYEVGHTFTLQKGVTITPRGIR